MAGLLNSQAGWIILIISLILIGIVGAIPIRIIRVKALKQWDLNYDLTAPQAKWQIWIPIIIFALLWIAIVTHNLLLPVHPTQQIINSVASLIGCLIGVTICLLSLHRATQLYKEGKA